jgi:hypothetical protein
MQQTAAGRSEPGGVERRHPRHGRGAAPAQGGDDACVAATQLPAVEPPVEAMSRSEVPARRHGEDRAIVRSEPCRGRAPCGRGDVGQPRLAARALTQKLESDPGACDVTAYGSEAAARGAIEDREVYGAFVAGPSGAKVLTASGASPAVAQALTHAAADIGGGAGAGAGPVVEDVAPAPRGAALGSSVLPLLIAGILMGVISTLLATGVLARTALIVTGSVLSGLVATAIVQSWLDVVGGDWTANAAVLSLTVLAIASIVAGLKSLFGEAGAALGAGANLLRSTGYFDGARPEATSRSWPPGPAPAWRCSASRPGACEPPRPAPWPRHRARRSPTVAPAFLRPGRRHVTAPGKPCPPEVHLSDVEGEWTGVNGRARCGHSQALAHDRRGRRRHHELEQAQLDLRLGRAA